MSIDYNELKKGGFLRQKQKDLFIMRLRTRGGNMTAEQLRKVAELAEKYGRGYVHFTTRQGAEIPWVHVSQFDEMRQEILAAGLITGTCGPRIRTVVACPGNEICQFGLMNSRQMAGHLDEAFFGREVPMKTKIAVAGCPNSCAKPQENDIGFVGVVEPFLNEDKCMGCGLCARVCPGKAITMDGEKPVFDRSKCIFEGNCIASCPVDAWEEQRRGYDVYAGGKIGRFPALGLKVAEFVGDDEVIPTVERILKVFERYWQRGERIANTIRRIGPEKFKAGMEEEQV